MTHSSVTISVARVGDAVGIQDVYYRGWLETYPNKEVGISHEDIEDWYKDRYAEATLKALKDRIAQPFTTEVTFIARSHVRIIGVCKAKRHEDRNELRSLYVLRGYLGKGIGVRMWNTARDYLDPKKATYVDVAAYNEIAIAFYRRQGFADIGARVHDRRFTFKSGVVMPLITMRREPVRAPMS